MKLLFDKCSFICMGFLNKEYSWHKNGKLIISKNCVCVCGFDTITTMIVYVFINADYLQGYLKYFAHFFCPQIFKQSLAKVLFLFSSYRPWIFVLLSYTFTHTFHTGCLLHIFIWQFYVGGTWKKKRM